ncbi:MAG: sulfotransferase, partial [Pseudomonadota bacterium]|nr:sulfotransferase [Pseudomonadota bacterium]
MSEALRKPNLFIIGAMKSGTTSLHEYLDTHPQIAMSREKEPGYFVEELSLRKGEDWYLSLFEQDARYQYVGESSTHYTKLPLYRGVPERLFRFNPDARLIYIMRDPFDRVISHYWHAVRDVHHGGELRPLLKAVQECPDYLCFSDYAMQLEPYIER